VEDGRAISVRAIIVGALLGVLFAGSMSYIGAKTAFIDGGNIPASIIAFGVLSAVLRRKPTVHDGNVVQTVSSSAAMMAITGGCIGPVAALWIVGTPPSMPLVIVWGISLGLVGCIVAAPLRAIFIERSALPFPSGTATAAVLTALFRDAKSARRQLTLLALAGVACFAFGMARSYLGWFPETSYLPFVIAGVSAQAIGVGVSWSPLLLGLGFLSGPRVAMSLVVGSIITWVVIAPQLVNAGIREPDYIALLNWLLWPGTGLMIGGTLQGGWIAMRSVRASFKGHGRLQMSRRHVLGSLAASAAVVGSGALVFEVNPLFPLFGLGIAMVVSVAAARAIGETDNTPAGPIGGVMQVAAGAIAPGGIHAPLSAGGVVNGVLMHSAFMLQNWKTGSLTHTPPRTLFIAQLVGVVVGAVVCAGAFLLIANAYGLGTESMPAPAALSWKATAEIARTGIDALPRHAPLAAAIGLVLGFVLSLKPIARYAPYPVTMGVAVILPPHMALVMALGGFGYGLATRTIKSRTDEDGLPLASGMIAGEALAGITTAALIALGLTP
jgi:uncharacterized oligopeptide transporter (OPT) family protein